MSDFIQIGAIRYTQEQIDEINTQYGPGFLQKNPHYPAPGIYVYSDGSASAPFHFTIEQRELMKKS